MAYYAGIQAAIPATMSFGAGILFVVVFTQVAVSEQRLRTEAERLAQELGEANRQLREYATQVEELAVARERNRMAREIHDSLGHYLTAVNMQLEAARAVLASDPAKAQDALSKAQGLTREGLADVRRSVAALRVGPADDRPLAEALAALVRESEAAGVPAALDVRGSPRPAGTGRPAHPLPRRPGRAHQRPQARRRRPRQAEAGLSGGRERCD